MPRAEFSRKVKAAAIERANGHCEKCKAKLKHGEAEVDHILPCALGGEPVIANAQVLCSICHKAKTGDDVRRVRKADRQRDKDSGAVRPKQKIKSRGFDKPDRAPKIIKPDLPPRRLYAERIEL